MWSEVYICHLRAHLLFHQAAILNLISFIIQYMVPHVYYIRCRYIGHHDKIRSLPENPLACRATILLFSIIIIYLNFRDRYVIFIELHLHAASAAQGSGAEKCRTRMYLLQIFVSIFSALYGLI